MPRAPRVLLIVLSILAAGLAACASRPASLHTYQLGEKAQVGHLVYSAYETQWVKQIGEGPEARIPQHRFFYVRITVTNAAGETVAAPNLSVLDDQGSAFEELSDGDGVPQWIGFLRQIAPADTVRGNMVFDVPPTHYRLRIADETGENTALIDLPLDFSGNEPPELPNPGLKQ